MRSATDRPSSDVAPGRTITSLPSTDADVIFGSEHMPDDVGDSAVGKRGRPTGGVGYRIDLRNQHRHWLPRRESGRWLAWAAETNSSDDL